MWVAVAGRRRSRWRKKSARPATSSASTSRPRCWRAPGRLRRLALPVDFVLADATVYPFDPASSDLLVSRFGVMFFAEPALSFANMRKALRPSGRLTFACWREPRDNPWLLAPLQAAYKHVPKLPQLGPEDPGPFSFAAEQRVRRILGEAGFSEHGDGAAATCRSMSRSGAVLMRRWNPRSKSARRAARSQGQPSDLRAAAAKSIREALAPFAKGNTVPLAASIWIVTASAS